MPRCRIKPYAWPANYSAVRFVHPPPFIAVFEKRKAPSHPWNGAHNRSRTSLIRFRSLANARVETRESHQNLSSGFTGLRTRSGPVHALFLGLFQPLI